MEINYVIDTFFALFSMILIIFMVVIAILRSQVVGRKMKGPNPKVVKIKAGMLMLNILLGILVLLLSSISSAL